MNDGEADGGEGVDAQRANPVRPIEPEAMSEPEDDRRQRRRDVPVDEVEEEQLAHLDVHRSIEVEGGEPIGLERRKEAENRRRSEHPPERRRPGALHLLTTIRARYAIRQGMSSRRRPVFRVASKAIGGVRHT